MAALYVTSSAKGAGKTAVCAGLGKQLVGKGKIIGFFKPAISISGKAAGEDGDARLMKHLFSLAEAEELLCPVLSSGGDLPNSVRDAYARVVQEKDVVIIEGASEHYQTARDIVRALDARVLVVEAYSRELLRQVDSYRAFGDSLLGVVLNKVPKSRVEQVKAEATVRLAAAGTILLGVLPEDRLLLAISIGEIAEIIQGEMLSGVRQTGDLVENLMLGAMGLDPGPDYFGRKANKAVVLKSERTDMQLAALQTSTRCLVLAGDSRPHSLVLDNADKKKVPIISAKGNVATLVESIQNAIVGAKFSQPNKMPRLTEIIEQSLDFATVYKGLGFAG